jgi:uncharacterized membrane protein
MYQLLHISATWYHSQGVKNSKRFVIPKRVVVVAVVVVVVVVVVTLLFVIVVVLVVVVLVVVTVEISFGLILSYEIRCVGLGQDIANNFGSIQA